MEENGGLMGWVVEHATEIKAIGGSAFVLLTAATLYIANLIKDRQRLRDPKNNVSREGPFTNQLGSTRKPNKRK